ncbi:nicotinate-nucleotide--dimethylbenzimidazole phosphoribosyltransferase [Paraglaciecola aquimarina]|uniref:Nicotinate-nucleotide--dimethylbenzimidazole phosphoribosyltransferase n=1 Tax=Paraglaciecola aquimarina TaxID=1235557 RepID=A0ABU3T136_9ALTE|nr:nicotinate-nucleotide--dimethylbenzimidazole phosphoribosyltransferase [Paraglaciecola aquimarina]MDU0355961.1 nicotinate-nucleotide--dimethylbenzimidazole phosphoribosyltransferase [Paraglaciecola aquimarina]
MSKQNLTALDAAFWQIPTLDTNLLAAIQHKIDNKTKPLGALGQLEEVARQVSPYTKPTD